MFFFVSLPPSLSLSPALRLVGSQTDPRVSKPHYPAYLLVLRSLTTITDSMQGHLSLAHLQGIHSSVQYQEQVGKA